MSVQTTTTDKCTTALECTVAQCAEGGIDVITERLEQLDMEWTARRMTRATGCALVVGGCLFRPENKRWAILPLAGSLLLAHSFYSRRGLLDGLFERLGFRSGVEINRERRALMTLRGDYHGLPTLHDVENREDIDRLEGEGGLVVDQEQTKLDPREAAHELLHATQ